MFIKDLNHNFTFRLLFIILCIVGVGFIGMQLSLNAFINSQVVKEKQTMLFGLTRLLDNALSGSFEDILEKNDALEADREEQISILNRDLQGMTDFVASGNEGVGVGYYSRRLDSIITYGPYENFSHTIGQAIFEGHKGYEVMEAGKAMVQKGELVRGSILNCMTPIVRNGQVIGYIWANVTLENISKQMTKLNNQMLFLLILTFSVIYSAVVFTTQRFVGDIDVIRDGIQQVIKEPQHRLPHLQGELNMVVEKVNELSDSVALYKSYNRYVLSSVTNGVLAVSDTGIVALANPSFRKLFHLEDREITGKRLTELFDDSLVHSIQSINEKGGGDESRTFTYEQKIFECYGNRIISDSGRNLGNAYVLKDITVMRQYEKELQERERMITLGEMGLNLAHEIKNPLTSVKGFTQLMQHRTIGEEQKQYYLGLMNEELERVNTLLNDMLTYGGRHKVHPESVDLKELLEELKIIYQVTYPSVNFELETDDFGAPNIILDRSKIIQLIDNLVKNSVDAGSDCVGIQLNRDDDSVWIKIRDNGAGIPEEISEKIFTPFFTTKERGTGFGLSLCAEVASIHGGGLTVDSVVDEYTEFTLKLNPKFMESPDGN